MKKSVAATALTVTLAISIPTAASAQSSTPQDTNEVTKVTEAFRQALIAHDGKRFVGLFIPEGGACWNMLSDDAYAAARAKNPHAARLRYSKCSDFAKFLSTTKDAIDETTNTNLQIHTDGTVATASFDFFFFINGKPQGCGLETWQLVKGADGWRITAVTYSSHPMK